MHFNFPYIFHILLASAVLADRGRENHYQLAERDSDTDTTGPPIARSATSNLAGATLIGSYITESFYGIKGTFVVPNISGVVGSGVALLVNIGGGDGCDNLIQAGVTLSVTENGTSGNAWFEWYPQPSGDISEVSISPGNRVRVDVGLASDLESAIIFVENFSTEESNARFVNVPQGYSPCTRYAGWIVEDYVVNGAMAPFANFTPVTFTDAKAFGSRDEPYGPQNANTSAMIGYGPSLLIRAYVSFIDADTVTIRRGSG